MLRKPQVFLSSTWNDLQTHREIVLFTLTSLKWLFEAMEYFGALPGEPLEECLASVMRSDIYIGVLGTRYGSVDPYGVSITQREYEQAFASKKTILIFLLDEGKHPVLPKDVETGAGAQKLADFKSLLKSRHVCAFFSSAEELALKVSIALARLLNVDQETEVGQTRIEELRRQVPILLAASGYGVTLSEHVSDLSGIFSAGEDGKVIVDDLQFRNLLTAGFIALRLSKRDFTVLKDIMTFDKELWSLMIILLTHYGVDPVALRSEMATCNDAVELRLLIKIAGELRYADCTELLCEITLAKLPALSTHFNQVHQGPVTPLEDVIKIALSSMPQTVLPIVETYLEKARLLKRWKQKQIFEAAARALRTSGHTDSSQALL